ncbi:Protein of unknown function [Evansella caseinilytica]|uniref:DUF1292 domain-containing protein n=1 Tax=Evansella caseinilytica TaxID=1503961 RepID=A0A1H3SYZ1_9BACI|nr:DUF1292 domain-containing protein [Evansella caseinilytica]SDZ42725.1 Protein of unknown function [Evansella caseinilytica]
MDRQERDTITIKDDGGHEKNFQVEAQFEMNNQSYALITGDTETLLMRIIDEDEEQYLVGITDPEEKRAILDAYQIAVEANPADDEQSAMKQEDNGEATKATKKKRVIQSEEMRYEHADEIYE